MDRLALEARAQELAQEGLKDLLEFLIFKMPKEYFEAPRGFTRAATPQFSLLSKWGVIIVLLLLEDATGIKYNRGPQDSH